MSELEFRHSEVKKIFHQAVEMPPHRRMAYLDLACGEDRALRQSVEDLLAAHDEAGSFLEEGALDEPDVTGAVDRVVAAVGAGPLGRAASPGEGRAAERNADDEADTLESPGPRASGGSRTGQVTEAVPPPSSAGRAAAGRARAGRARAGRAGAGRAGARAASAGTTEASPPRPALGVDPKAPTFELDAIGKYRNLVRVGQGAMGRVYRAHDPVLDRPVAIKTILTSSAMGTEEGTIRRFQREARLAAGLNHPSIVTVYDFGQEDGIFYLVMEYLEGADLGKLLRRRELDTVEQKLRVMEKVCEGMAFAHDKGTVHRDLKPSNIFCLPGDRIKIVDFGLARLTESAKTTLGVAGTPQYMSPEQVRGEAVDARSDVFSLGAMFYEMLTARRCFPAPTLHAILFQVLQRQPESVRQLDPHLPALADLIISKALTKETSLRFAHAGELLEGIQWLRRVMDGDCLEKDAIEAMGLAADPDQPRKPFSDPLDGRRMGEAVSVQELLPEPVSGLPDVRADGSVSIKGVGRSARLKAENPGSKAISGTVEAEPEAAATAEVVFLNENGGPRQLEVVIADSPTVLQVALDAGIRHYHECGGRGRCSTCRVRVAAGTGNLLPRNRTEARLAARLGWDSEIRLACQARVVGNVRVQRLIHDAEDFGLLRHENKRSAPRETTLAVLSCRLRNANEVLQRSAPYDIVHLLNRFYFEVGEPVLAAGGQVSEYRDGTLVAYFGIDGGSAREKCIAATRAALRIVGRLEELNRYLVRHFDFEADIGLGLHFGRTIVGNLGHPSSMYVTALGDLNPVAAWIAGLERKTGVAVLASEDLVNVIEEDLDLGEVVAERDVRGHDRPCWEIHDFLKPDGVLLVQTSFDAVAPRKQEAAETFYRLLFEIDPKIERLFAGVDMATQGDKLMQVLGTAVQGLDRLEELIPVVQDLGRRHAGYGVRLEHYDAVEQALIEMLHQMLGQAFTVDLRMAWSKVYNTLAEVMIGASEDAPTETHIVR